MGVPGPPTKNARAGLFGLFALPRRPGPGLPWALSGRPLLLSWPLAPPDLPCCPAFCRAPARKP